MNEPLTNSIRIFNEFSDLFEVGGSRNGFRVRIKERTRIRASVVLSGSHFFHFFFLNALFSKNMIFIFSFFVMISFKTNSVDIINQIFESRKLQKYS
jgi:hypothetical protein